MKITNWISSANGIHSPRFMNGTFFNLPRLGAYESFLEELAVI
jgi:hypothetical protein